MSIQKLSSTCLSSVLLTVVASAALAGPPTPDKLNESNVPDEVREWIRLARPNLGGGGRMSATPPSATL